MGARGPVRDPFSRRGQAEARLQMSEGLGSAGDSPLSGRSPGRESMPGRHSPPCPQGLPARVEAIWYALLDEMVAAAVPVEAIDGYAITQTAQCLYSAELTIQLAESDGLDAKGKLAALSLRLRASDQLLKWLDKIGATPASRVRLGIKAPPEKKPSAIEKILQDRAR